MAVRRYDAGSMGAVEITPQGGLRIPSTPTRVGVFPYRQADGTTRREYRPASEVFDPSSLATLRSAPVTDDHPVHEGVRVSITADNWRSYAVGHVGEDIRPEGDHVGASILILDRSMIEKVQAGKRRELSCGYSCDLDMTPGVAPDGQIYDAIQTKIVYNHVALGEDGWGRQGPTASLRLDAADAIQEETAVEKETINGVEYTVGSKEWAAAVRAERDREKGRADAAESRAKPATAIDPKLVHAAAVKRADLLSTADRVARIKGTRVDKDTVAAATDDQLVASIIKMIDPTFPVEGKTPDYLAGALTMMVKTLIPAVSEDPAEDPPATTLPTDSTITPPPPGPPMAPRHDAAKVVNIFAAREGAPPPARGKGGADPEGDRHDSDKARADMLTKDSDRWRKPVGMTRT